MEGIQELLGLLFPTEGMADTLQKIPAELFNFKNYTVVMYIALAISVALLAGGLIFGIQQAKNDFSEFKKCGILSIILALIGAPLFLLSLGGFLGNYVWIAQIAAILLYLICQCILDYEQVGWNSLFGIGVIVFGALALLLATPNLNSDSETTDAMMKCFAMVIPCGAIVSTVAGIAKLYLEYARLSPRSTSEPISASTSTYLDLFDARDQLRSQLDLGTLSPSEKEALVKAHNDKYLDHITVRDGRYYNFSED